MGRIQGLLLYLYLCLVVKKMREGSCAGVTVGGCLQGEFSDIKEANYLGPRGYTVDSSAPPALLDSLVYKLSYYGCVSACMHLLLSVPTLRAEPKAPDYTSAPVHRVHVQPMGKHLCALGRMYAALSHYSGCFGNPHSVLHSRYSFEPSKR